MSTLLAAALPLLGVVIGALVQHHLSGRADWRKRTIDSRTHAYADFLRAVAHTAHSRTGQALQEAADAKARISIYGSADVVSALAAFDRAGAELQTEQGQSAFIALVLAMRADAANREDVISRDIATVLLGASAQARLPRDAA